MILARRDCTIQQTTTDAELLRVKLKECREAVNLAPSSFGFWWAAHEADIPGTRLIGGAASLCPPLPLSSSLPFAGLEKEGENGMEEKV